MIQLVHAKKNLLINNADEIMASMVFGLHPRDTKRMKFFLGVDQGLSKRSW